MNGTEKPIGAKVSAVGGGLLSVKVDGAGKHARVLLAPYAKTAENEEVIFDLSALPDGDYPLVYSYTGGDVPLLVVEKRGGRISPAKADGARLAALLLRLSALEDGRGALIRRVAALEEKLGGESAFSL